jgi:hypothetical protein
VSYISRRQPRSPEALPWIAGSALAAGGFGALVAYSPVIGATLLAIVAVSYFVLRNPAAGVFLLAGFTPIISALRRGLIVPGLRPSEVLVVWLAPLVILGARRPIPRWGALEGLGLLYAATTCGLGVLDVWARGGQFTQDNIGQLIGPFQYLVLFRAVRVGISTSSDRNTTAAIVLLSSVPVAILALLQGFGARWAHHLEVSLTGVDLGHLDRATGLFTSWQVLAGYLFIVGVLAAAAFAFRARHILRAPVALAVLVVDCAALARTLTIGALIGWLIGCVIVMILARRVHVTRSQIVVLLCLGIGLIGIVFAARFHQQYGSHGSTSLVPRTISDRYAIWAHQYIPSLSGRWVTGYGPGIPADVGWKFTESVYVTMVLRGGLLLLAVYLALMAAFIDVARRARAQSAELRALGGGVLVAVCLLFPLQVIATYFTTSGLPEVLWIVLGLVVAGSADRANLTLCTARR